MSLNLQRRGAAEAAIVRIINPQTSNIININDDRVLLYSRLPKKKPTSFCLRDYSSGLELRGNVANIKIVDIEKVITDAGYGLIADHVDTTSGIQKWTIEINRINGNRLQKLTARGYWRPLKKRQ